MMAEAVVVGASSTARARRKWSGRQITPWLFLAPWILGVLIFYAYPILSSVYYSFTEYDVLTPARWTGLRNYRQLLDDRYFHQALTNTLLFVAVAVPGALLSGLLQALLLNVALRGQQLFRTLALVPGTIPVAAASAVWLYILTPGAGLINNIFRTFGLPTQAWIADPLAVKWVFVGMAILDGAGMLIFLAALQAVPQELYEAAEVDGATWLKRLTHVTLPMITPAILFNLLLGLIAAFQYFTFPMLMTAGGPVGGSTFFGQYLYQSAFLFWRMGYASAQAWILFIICAVVVFTLFRTSARWVYYEAEAR
jgi:multiple sugar transport system permease protein